jgi:hypothetical protein
MCCCLLLMPLTWAATDLLSHLFFLTRTFSPALPFSPFLSHLLPHLPPAGQLPEPLAPSHPAAGPPKRAESCSCPESQAQRSVQCHAGKEFQTLSQAGDKSVLMTSGVSFLLLMRSTSTALRKPLLPGSPAGEGASDSRGFGLKEDGTRIVMVGQC